MITRRRRRLLVVVVVLLAMAAGAIVFATMRKGAATKSPKESNYAFEMCVGHRSAAADDAASGGVHKTIAWPEIVVAAIARSLTTDERSKLEEALTLSSTRLEAEANSFVDDLEDSGEDPDAPIRAWFKAAPTFVRTGQAASRIRDCAPDGFCAAPADRGNRCPASFALSSDERDTGRARFLLWPWGYALRFRAPTEEIAKASAALLRDRLRVTGTHIAIVMAADDTPVTTAEPFVNMRAQWKRLMVVQAIARHQQMDPVALGFAPVIEGPNEIIVMPRLDSIFAKSGLEAEVIAAAPQLVRFSATTH